MYEALLSSMSKIHFLQEDFIFIFYIHSSEHITSWSLAKHIEVYSQGVAGHIHKTYIAARIEIADFSSEDSKND